MSNGDPWYPIPDSNQPYGWSDGTNQMHSYGATSRMHQLLHQQANNNLTATQLGNHYHSIYGGIASAQVDPRSMRDRPESRTARIERNVYGAFYVALRNMCEARDCVCSFEMCAEPEHELDVCVRIANSHDSMEIDFDTLMGMDAVEVSEYVACLIAIMPPDEVWAKKREYARSRAMAWEELQLKQREVQQQIMDQKMMELQSRVVAPIISVTGTNTTGTIVGVGAPDSTAYVTGAWTRLKNIFGGSGT